MIKQHANVVAVIKKIDPKTSDIPQELDKAVTELATEQKTLYRRVKRSLVLHRPADFPLFEKGLETYFQTGDMTWYCWSLNKKGGLESFEEMKQVLTEYFESINVGLSRQWIEKQIKEKALNRRLAANLKRQYKKEDFDDLLSHTNEWLMHWAEIGQFDEWLAEHGSIKPSVLTAWLIQKMRTKVFARGKDALTRSRTGARTQYEMSKGQVHKESLEISSESPDVVLQQGETEGEFVQCVVSYDTEPADLDPNYRLEFVKDIIRLSRPKASDRYLRIFQWMCQDYSLDEIAEVEGLSKTRAAKLTQKVRDDLKEGHLTAGVAKKILKEICEEPYSTRSDLEGILSKDENKSLPSAIKILSYRKMIEENHQGCFLATKDGEFGIYSGEFF